MAKQHLDISIKSADKVLGSERKISDFFNNEITVEHKTDGVKLTVIKQNNNGSIDDYLFAYKGNILFPGEYDYAHVEDRNIGCSQFKKVFDHFKQLPKNNIPIGTELFIEFLMNKPTLSSNYTNIHQMVLIGHSQSTHNIHFGNLSTSNNGFHIDQRNEYANCLQIDVPQVLFSGFFNKEMFIDGIKQTNLMELFLQSNIDWDNPKQTYEDLKCLFLSVPSVYGGLEEGVILQSENILLKWQQDYQLDKEARFLIKQKYRETPELELQYWDNVKKSAFSIIENIDIKPNINDSLIQLSNKLKSFSLQFSHSKKSVQDIKDDIQLNCKSLIIKKTPGNNNALIIGKFRVLTKDGHMKMIEQALEQYDDIVICLVTSKETRKTKELRSKMLMKAFPNVRVIHSTNANIVRLIGQSPININAIFCGSDRVQAYKEQIKHSVGIKIEEIKRNDSDISATKVLNDIDNNNHFYSNTPECIHEFYEDLRMI